jgi:uncharacterized membrane protein
MLVVMIAGVVGALMILTGNIPTEFKEATEEHQNIIGTNIIIAAFPLGIAALLTLLFPLLNMISNPKNLIRFGITLGAFGLVTLLSYSLASGNIESYMLEADYLTTESGSKFVGTMIYLIYIVGGLAVVTIVGSSLTKLFNR